MQKEQICIHWFRRDLRLNDNHSLKMAFERGFKVILLFVFDTEILNRLEDKDDFRISIIHDALFSINASLKSQNGALTVFHGKPAEAFLKLIEKFDIQKVYANEDFEPYGINRDDEIKKLLNSNGIEFQLYNDHLIMHPNFVLKENGQPYTVYTAYKNKWFSLFKSEMLNLYETPCFRNRIVSVNTHSLPSIMEIGFSKNRLMNLQAPLLEKDVIAQYEQTRNYPGLEGTTRIGTHLRFGLISIRHVAKLALESSIVLLQELV